jgi:hypothetical protein
MFRERLASATVHHITGPARVIFIICRPGLIVEKVERYGGTTESMMVRVIGLAGIPSRWDFVDLGVFRFNEQRHSWVLMANCLTAETDRIDHGSCASIRFSSSTILFFRLFA